MDLIISHCKAVFMLSRVAKSPQGDLLISKLLKVPLKILLLCIHTSITLTFIACFVASLVLIVISEVDFLNNKFLCHGFHNKEYFFSLWVLGAEVVCFMIYSVIDVLIFYRDSSTKALKIRKTLYNVASHLLFSIAFPLSIVVFILFWSFYFWDRELIYPAIMDDIFPPFLNHVMHSYPVLFSILYMFTDVRSEPPKSKTFASLAGFMATYSLTMYWVLKTKGVWVYPVLEVLTPTQITWVLSFTLIGSFVFYFLGYYIYSKIKEIRTYLRAELTKIKDSLEVKLKKS